MAGQITRIQNYQTNWPLKVPSWRFSTLCLSGLGEEIVGSLIFMQKVQKQLGWPNDWFTIPKPTGSIHEWWLKIVHFLSLALSGLFKSSLQNSKLCIIYTCIYIYYKIYIYKSNTSNQKGLIGSESLHQQQLRSQNFCWPNPSKVCCFAWSVCSRSTSPASPLREVVLRPLKMQQSVGWRPCNVTWQTNQPKIGWKSWRSWVCQVDDLFFLGLVVLFLDVNYNWN